MSYAASLPEGVDKSLVLSELDRVDSEESLRKYVERSWHILEPGRTFVPGWHIDAVCEHLEAISKEQITRLLINVPPGCMKSLTTDVFWPTWEWGPRNRPDLRYVSASYSQDLTVRDNRRARNLIRNDWYQQKWGNRYKLVGEQNAKMRFDNDHMGFKIATSVGGLGTGERGDRFIIDDPHNIKETESDAKREAALLWFTEVVPTRVNDPEKSALVVIMQRVHERDISGHIVAKELGYTHLMLPMEFEEERKCKTFIFEDPRKKDGELLWKDRMTEKVVERDKKVMGQYAIAAQFQQRPSPRGGGMFKEDWFEIIDPADVPNTLETVRGWDLASTKSERAAWTAGVKMGRCTRTGTFYVLNVMRFRESAGKVEAEIISAAYGDGFLVTIDLPRDPGQAGKFQVKYMRRQLAGFTVKSSPETGSKEQRASPLASQAEAGNVKLVRSLWNDDYLAELTTFPFSEFKDQVDASSRAFAALIKPENNELVGAEAIHLG